MTTLPGSYSGTSPAADGSTTSSRVIPPQAPSILVYEEPESSGSESCGDGRHPMSRKQVVLLIGSLADGKGSANGKGAGTDESVFVPDPVDPLLMGLSRSGREIDEKRRL